MSEIFALIKLPLSLPINPIYEFAILGIIDLIVYKIAFAEAGRYGSSSDERRELHWLIRIVLFVVLWLITCFIIWLVRFIKKHWIWVVAVVGVLVVTGVILLIVSHRKYKRTDEEDSSQ